MKLPYDYQYFYSHHLKHYHAWYGFAVRAYYRYFAHYCIARPSKIKPKSKILDIGCGIGSLVKELSYLGFEAVGVDVSEEAILNSVARSNCRLVKSTDKLNYPDGYFELITSREVLEHIEEESIDSHITEWGRISLGTMIHVIAVSERGRSAMNDPWHLNVKPEKWWKNKFEEHGYQVTLKPFKYFFSPYGSKGYFQIQRKI